MRVLITGGAGFIGGHLAEALLDGGHQVFVLDDLSTGSIDNIAHLKGRPGFHYTIDTVFNDAIVAELVDRADIVFHLAAAVGVKLIVQDPVHTIETNVHGTEVVLRHAAKKQKLVFIASTSEVYGKSTDVPFREDADLVMGPTSRHRWAYACSKALDEFLALAYHKQKRLPVIVVRFFNTVGPRQTARYGMVLPTFVRQALAGEAGNEIVLPVGQVYRFDNGEGTRKLDRHTLHTKNLLGFRGPDPPPDFAERLTIVTIGGSTTESLFLSDGRTWTDRLRTRLDAELPGVWVNNAGIDGHSTFGHLVLLRSVMARLRPKVALFLIGANDVGMEHANTFDAGTAATPGGVRKALNGAAAHSELVNFVWNVARVARARDRGLGHSEVDLAAADDLHLDPEVFARTEAQYRQYLPGYAERLRQIAAVSREHGIEPVWLTQPALFGSTVDPSTGIDLTDVRVNGRGNGALEWRLLEMYNDTLRAVAAAEGVPLIDLARLLPKDSRYYYDFIHFTNDGSDAVGDIVAAPLIEWLKQRR